MLQRLIAALLFIVIALPASAALYTWRDANGVTNVSDQPPGEQQPEGAPEVRKIEVPEFTTVTTRRLPQSPVNLDKLDGKPEQEKPALPPIVMYSTEWCAICKQAKHYLKQQSIPYVERDIEKSSEARKDFRELKGDGVPLIVLGEKILAGFSRPAFDDFYKP